MKMDRDKHLFSAKVARQLTVRMLASHDKKNDTNEDGVCIEDRYLYTETRIKKLCIYRIDLTNRDNFKLL